MRFALFLFASVLASSAATPLLPAEVVDTQRAEDRPLSPAEALTAMTLPEGFRVTLFAGEPDVMQPIAMDFDDRGRLWVVENYSYPDFKREDVDRVIILTDRDGDGRFDERKVFLEGGHRLSGITLGFGGVWLCSAPNLIFIPERNGDDRPDGPPEVVLDGFTLKAGHNMVNGLAWGPDGWLYGRHGITAPSLIGRPGTPETKRVQLSCSIWRYHPVRQVVEVVTHGTTNPWGHDWDDFGQLFFSNNVIGHFWHVVPGAHYARMFGEDFNPHVYQLMKATSDHQHWAGTNWTASRGGKGDHDGLGGGHSHCGLMIYLGDNGPASLRGQAYMGNIHGNRILYDVLERRGSGYVARHGGNFLAAHDPWFRSVSQIYGPDGGIWVSDWNDLGECHDMDGAKRSSGRIYKIAHGPRTTERMGDLAQRSDADLVALQLHANDWWVRHARRLLQERAQAGTLKRTTRPTLQKLLETNPEVTRKLRALWALHVIGATDEEFLSPLLQHESEHIRWWAVQLLVENRSVSGATREQFAQLARTDSSAFVRLALASALQRLPLADRWEIARALAAHEEDAQDANLPLMIWYGIEPAVAADRVRALEFIAACKLQVVRQFATRRLAGKIVGEVNP